MARKLRTLQFPLASVGSSSSSSSSASKPGVLVNPVLSHWGLLVGETDLLVEIMAKAGKSKWAPLLELHVSEPISKDAIKERKGEFKWGIFNLPDTEFANWRIVDAAKRIVNSKKYYNLATYNCQSFVKDLVKAITPSSFWNTAGDIVSRIPLLGPFLRDDGSEAASIDRAAVEAGIIAELDILYGLKERWLTGPNVTTYTPEIGPDEPEPPQIDARFTLEEQPYMPGGKAEELSEFGVVYDSVDHPVFEVARIPVPDSPDQLTQSDKAKLKIAEALVGTKPN